MSLPLSFKIFVFLVVGAPPLEALAQGAPVTAEATAQYEVTRNSADKLILDGRDCSSLPEQIKSLRTWRITLNEPPPSLGQNVKCPMDITDLAPSFVRGHQGMGTAHNGPNCWNTSLFLSGIVPFLRFSSESEMTFWMASPYCHELKKNEPPLPGDVIAMRSYDLRFPPKNGHSYSRGEMVEVHGMIYLSPDLVFSKNTSGRDSPYELQRPDFIVGDFGLHDPACNKITGLNPKCLYWANYFRCRSPELDRQKWIEQDAEFAKLHQHLSEINLTVSALVTSGTPLFNTADIKTQLTELRKQLMTGNTTKTFFGQAALLETESLLTQIQILLQESSPRRQ